MDFLVENDNMHTQRNNSVTVANALIVNGDQAIKIWRHVHVYI